jgi:hypothetical protein
MIFGIDMSQTAEGKGGSVAAVVGSMDNNFTEYVSYLLTPIGTALAFVLRSAEMNQSTISVE